ARVGGVVEVGRVRRLERVHVRLQAQIAVAIERPPVAPRLEVRPVRGGGGGGTARSRARHGRRGGGRRGAAARPRRRRRRRARRRRSAGGARGERQNGG